VIRAFSSSNTTALFPPVISLAGLGVTTANYWALTRRWFHAVDRA
jgi:hypothetical protein